MICETSFPNLFDRFYATIHIEYELTENGRDIEWLEVKVTSLTGDNWDRTWEELKALGWANWLNAKVTAECERLIKQGEWLKWELIVDD